MKKFKNYVSYSGNKEQLERYAAELIKAGFNWSFGCEYWEDNCICIISYEHGYFGFYNHTGNKSPLLFSQDQFTEALKAATEPA